MQSLKTLNQITLSLAKINDFDHLVYQSIQQGIERLGFTRLSIWFLDDNNHLVGKYRVDNIGNIIENAYESMSLNEDHPAYDVLFITQESSIHRDTTLYNVHMGEIGHGDKAFVPMLDGDKVIGCLYSDTLIDDAPFSDEAIEMLNLYGAALGMLFNRQQSRQALEQREADALEFQKQLKALNEITITLSAIDNLNDLTYQVIKLGLDKLHFERMGIWFNLDDNPTMRQGMWGTDQDGNIRNEQHIITPIPEYEAGMVSEGDVVVVENNDIAEVDGEFIRKGWTLIGLMWDGTKRIGWLYADNATSGTPLQQNQHEIFRLYAATVGSLCAKRIAEDKLRQSEVLYRAITESSSDVVVIIDENAKFTYITPSVQYVMNIDPQRVVGQSVTDMIHPDDLPLAQQTMRECLRERELRTRINDIRVWRIDGRWVHMEAVVTSLLDNPAVNGIVVSCRDITERLIAEERKRYAEQERERSWLLRQFISDVSHDFRTPLSTIGTYAYLIKSMSESNIESRVDVIQEQIRRITDLIDNMNTIAKLDETSDNNLPIRPTSINTLLDTVLVNSRSECQQKRLTITPNLQPDLPAIRGNARLLHDAFVHIFNNAIQYSSSGGTIDVTSKYDNEDIIVEIKDSGTGIAKEDLPYIFDSLYRADKARNANNGGGGMGLAITRRIIELHNGKIQVDSEVDKGTTITLIFPSSQIIHTD